MDYSLKIGQNTLLEIMDNIKVYYIKADIIFEGKSCSRSCLTLSSDSYKINIVYSNYNKETEISDIKWNKTYTYGSIPEYHIFMDLVYLDLKKYKDHQNKWKILLID
uniref:Uncharacterized protein n=1 Tax=Pithovirus LCPAC102 TaxID=2506587 RepID=A0A481Z6A5_9VIRU|nr:MAG: hypothetical protein LCPAC102_01030 [Pithovirus LCPAC102]